MVKWMLHYHGSSTVAGTQWTCCWLAAWCDVCWMQADNQRWSRERLADAVHWTSSEGRLWSSGVERQLKQMAWWIPAQSCSQTNPGMYWTHQSRYLLPPFQWLFWWWTCSACSLSIFTQATLASAVLAVVMCLSVRLSVRPSVISRCSTDMAKHRITQTMPYNASLVLWCRKSRQNWNAKEVPSTGGVG